MPTPRTVDMLVIHHTGTRSASLDELVKLHRARGYSGLGFHYLITNGYGGENGQILQGRPEIQKGSAVFGRNTGKMHICLVGDFQSDSSNFDGNPTLAQMDSLGYWLKVMGQRYRIYDPTKVVGHREIAIQGYETNCPGDSMPLDFIRDWLELGAKGDLGTYLFNAGFTPR